MHKITYEIRFLVDFSGFGAIFFSFQPFLADKASVAPKGYENTNMEILRVNGILTF